jgi:hypothetical protein
MATEQGSITMKLLKLSARTLSVLIGCVACSGLANARATDDHSTDPAYAR